MGQNKALKEENPLLRGRNDGLYFFSGNGKMAQGGGPFDFGGRVNGDFTLLVEGIDNMGDGAFWSVGKGNLGRAGKGDF